MEVLLWVTLLLIVAIGSCLVIIYLKKKKIHEKESFGLIPKIRKEDENYTQTNENNDFYDNEIEDIEIEENDVKLPWEINSYLTTNMTLYEHPRPVALTDHLRSHVENIIKLSPNAKEIVKTERKVVVKFSEDVLNKFKTRELKLMGKKGTVNKFRPIAVDQKNIIRKHGWLEEVNIKKINPAQLANVALGVMTVITAQEHLANINNQLKDIDKKINTLISYFHNEKIGNIQGSIQYLKTILPDIINSNGDNDQIYLNKIEDISLQCYQDLHFVTREFPKIIEEINTLEVKTKFKMDNIINELNDKASLGEQYMHIALGNLEVLSICLKLRNELEENSEVNQNRLSELEKDYNQLILYHDTLNINLKKKQVRLNATFRRNNTIAKKKEEIAKQINIHKENIRDNISSVDNHIQKLRNPNNALINEVIDLQVEFDDENNIKAVYKLQAAN